MTRQVPSQDLAGHWRRFKEEGCPEARERLILHYGYLVVMTRERIYPKRPWEIDVEDLVSCGSLGLIQAVDRFDLGRGVRFETFAIARIRGAMREWLRHEDWLPRSVRDKQKQLFAAEQALAERGVPVTPAALAETLSLDPEQFARFLAEAEPHPCVSWEEVVHADEWDDLDPLYRKDGMVDPAPSPLAQVLECQEREHWGSELALLSGPVRQVIRRYYQEELTLKATARAMGFSESRAHQLHQRGLTTLRGRENVWRAMGRR